MDELLYQMIFKRKSFHVFKGEKKLSKDELQMVEKQINCLQPLITGINVSWNIVPRNETSCKRGEYCIMFYSEYKKYFLYNAGYMLEQLDLWLAMNNIGACWYGMGKTEEIQYKGLDFVIMIAIEKADEKEFRKDYKKTKRKLIDEIWLGNYYSQIVSVVRYAPSACNTQPWYVKATKEKLEVYRIQKKKKRGMMPANKVYYLNKIDIGIFLLFMELCLKHEKMNYELKLISDANEGEENLVATFHII